jgi:guanylate kinase
MKLKKIDPNSIIGHLFLIVGPSGSGKSSVIDLVRQTLPELHFPISATTRSARPGEVEGQDYYYLSDSDFDQKIAAGEFLEYANVHGHTRYGTLLSEVITPLQQGQNVIRHLDYQGVNSIREILPAGHVHVLYLDAGDWQSLLSRIQKRATLADEEVKRRKHSYAIEREFISSADHIISNNNGELNQAADQVVSIIRKYS